MNARELKIIRYERGKAEVLDFVTDFYSPRVMDFYPYNEYLKDVKFVSCMDLTLLEGYRDYTMHGTYIALETIAYKFETSIVVNYIFNDVELLQLLVFHYHDIAYVFLAFKHRHQNFISEKPIELSIVKTKEDVINAIVKLLELKPRGENQCFYCDREVEWDYDYDDKIVSRCGIHAFYTYPREIPAIKELPVRRI